MGQQGDEDLEGLDLEALFDRVHASANAFEQQQYRDAVIAHGAPAIAAIRERRWLCDRAVVVFASQIVRRVGPTNTEEAEAALRTALPCANDYCLGHINNVAKDLGIQLPPMVGAHMPSYMNPDTVYHIVADRFLGEGAPYGGMYLSKCGWVFVSEWVEEHLDRLDTPNQHLCGHCGNAK